MLRNVVLALCVGAVLCDRWDPVRAGLEAWTALQFDVSYAVVIGDATGELFSWAAPGFSIDGTRMPGASLSKWPAAVMISGLVADGIMSYDDRANKFLKFWATDPEDVRSGVTLRHLLSFTSGYTEDAGTNCSRVDAAFVQCAEQLYQVM